MELVFIGLGGIGTLAVREICRYVNFEVEESITVKLIDGDEFEPKNSERQEFSNLGPKAEVKCNELQQLYPRMMFESVCEYITEKNIEHYIEDGNIVIMGVDNHKTRKVVSDYVSNLDNIVLFSGGNDYVDGSVQIYIREGGEDITPSLTAHHDEIKFPTDKSPHEMSCEELHKVEPQLLFVNLGAALVICWAFYKYLTGGYKKGQANDCEIYFDMTRLAVNAVQRVAPQSR